MSSVKPSTPVLGTEKSITDNRLKHKGISVQGIIVTAVAVVLTLTSATMTVLGYTSLYSHNSIIIASLFIVLECSKATIFGVILVSGKVQHKAPLIILAALLIVASFIGHLSYLSKSYYTNQVAIQGNTEINESLKSSVQSQVSGIEAQIDILNQEIQAGNDEINQIRQRANDLAKASERNWVHQSNSKRVQEILEHNRTLSQEIQKLYQQRSQIQREYNNQLSNITLNTNEIASRSVFRYTADIFSIQQDRLANIINILLSLVIDTLALVLLWVAGDMWKDTKTQVSKVRNKGIKETKKPLTKAKNNINVENAKNFNFEGYTVDDVVSMSDKEIENLRNLVKSEDQLNWLNAALTIRNHADIKGKISRDTLLYKELD